VHRDGQPFDFAQGGELVEPQASNPSIILYLPQVSQRKKLIQTAPMETSKIPVLICDIAQNAEVKF